jgi:hypothetical protein
MTVGRVPALADEIWEAAAKSLSPDKSLERIETQARYLFSTVTVFGTLLTGFGLFSTGTRLGGDPRALLWPTVLVCLSLSLSMFALTPSTGRVNVNDLIEVRSYFARRLLLRGVAIFIAGLLFAAALLVVVPVVAHTTTIDRPTTTVTMKQAHTKEGDDVSASIKVQTLPSGADVDITAVAIGAAGETPIFRQHALRRDGGEISAEFSMAVNGDARRLRVTVVGTVRSEKVVEDVIALDLLPPPAPPPAKAKTKRQ